MTDTERLNIWMSEHGFDKKSLAAYMGEKYITVWAMIDRKKASDRFVSNFIRHFGCETALAVFADHLAPVLKH